MFKSSMMTNTRTYLMPWLLLMLLMCKSSGSEVLHRHGCMSAAVIYTRLHLGCPVGKYIEVLSARYGVSAYGLCVPTIRDCIQDAPLPVHCCHKQRCLVDVENTTIKPCGGWANYYQIKYICRSEGDVNCSAPLQTGQQGSHNLVQLSQNTLSPVTSNEIPTMPGGDTGHSSGEAVKHKLSDFSVSPSERIIDNTKTLDDTNLTLSDQPKNETVHGLYEGLAQFNMINSNVTEEEIHKNDQITPNVISNAVSEEYDEIDRMETVKYEETTLNPDSHEQTELTTPTSILSLLSGQTKSTQSDHSTANDNTVSSTVAAYATNSTSNTEVPITRHTENKENISDSSVTTQTPSPTPTPTKPHKKENRSERAIGDDANLRHQADHPHRNTQAAAWHLFYTEAPPRHGVRNNRPRGRSYPVRPPHGRFRTAYSDPPPLSRRTVSTDENADDPASYNDGILWQMLAKISNKPESSEESMETTQDGPYRNLTSTADRGSGENGDRHSSRGRPTFRQSERTSQRGRTGAGHVSTRNQQRDSRLTTPVNRETMPDIDNLKPTDYSQSEERDTSDRTLATRPGTIRDEADSSFDPFSDISQTMNIDESFAPKEPPYPRKPSVSRASTIPRQPSTSRVSSNTRQSSISRKLNVSRESRPISRQTSTLRKPSSREFDVFRQSGASRKVIVTRQPNVSRESDISRQPSDSERPSNSGKMGSSRIAGIVRASGISVEPSGPRIPSNAGKPGSSRKAGFPRQPKVQRQPSFTRESSVSRDLELSKRSSDGSPVSIPTRHNINDRSQMERPNSDSSQRQAKRDGFEDIVLGSHEGRKDSDNLRNIQEGWNLLRKVDERNDITKTTAATAVSTGLVIPSLTPPLRHNFRHAQSSQMDPSLLLRNKGPRVRPLEPYSEDMNRRKTVMPSDSRMAVWTSRPRTPIKHLTYGDPYRTDAPINYNRDLTELNSVLSPTAQDGGKDRNDVNAEKEEDIWSSNVASSRMSFGTLLLIACGEAAMFISLLIALALCLRRSRKAFLKSAERVYLRYDCDDCISNVTNTTTLTSATSNAQFQKRQPQSTGTQYNVLQEKRCQTQKPPTMTPVYHVAPKTPLPKHKSPVRPPKHPPPPPPRLDKLDEQLSDKLKEQNPLSTRGLSSVTDSPTRLPRKYFYEEACTAFNVPLPEPKQQSEMRPPIVSSSMAPQSHKQKIRTVSGSISTQSNSTSFISGSQDDGVSEGTPSHFSVDSFDTASYSNESEAPVLRDSRLKEFAESELQLIDEQIAVLFQGSDVGLGRRLSNSSYHC